MRKLQLARTADEAYRRLFSHSFQHLGHEISKQKEITEVKINKSN